MLSEKQAQKTICALLTTNAHEVGRRLSLVFEDWLKLTVATLRMQPLHLASMKVFGVPAPDPEDIGDLWKNLRTIYGQHGSAYPYFKRFAKAVGVLQALSSHTVTDILGPLYMEIGIPNDRTGQYFTPFDVCRMMADISCHSAPGLVYSRIRAEICQNLTPDKIEKYTSQQDKSWFWYKVLPELLDKIDPVTIYDPTVGSGSMLLAAASKFPRWMTEWGLVQFYGQDIDATCCMMAEINILVHGLNGHGLRCKVAAGHDIFAPAEDVDWDALLPSTLPSTINHDLLSIQGGSIT